MAKKKADTDYKADELHRLNGVEIFRSGTWNGDLYTVDDLDKMVAAFPDAGFRPPVKLGHKDESGDRAFGWVHSLRREGDKLIADLVDIPDKLFDAVQERGFDTVSSEVFWNLKRGDTTFSRVLKAVSLLGAEIPAVSDLKPLRDSVMFDTDASSYLYSFTKEDPEVDETKQADLITKLTTENAALAGAVKEMKTLLAAKGGDKDNAEIKALQEQIEARDKRLAAIETSRRNERIETKINVCRVPAYREFLKPLYQSMAIDHDAERLVEFKHGDKTDKMTAERVLDELVKKLNKDTEKLFAELAIVGDLQRDDVDHEDENTSAEVDRRTKEYMVKHDQEDYQIAMRAVLDSDPDLKTAYAQS